MVMDHCLYNNKNKIDTRSYIVTISYDFAKSIQDHLLNYNIKNSLNKVIKKPYLINGKREIKQKHIQYRINLGNKSTIKLLSLIYYPNHYISMPRKKSYLIKLLRHSRKSLHSFNSWCISYGHNFFIISWESVL